MQDTVASQNTHPEPEMVHITINRKRYNIPQGSLAVTSLKDWAEICAADEVEQVIDGKLEPLPDNATVQIKGGEKFISHPRDGGSS